MIERNTVRRHCLRIAVLAVGAVAFVFAATACSHSHHPSANAPVTVGSDGRIGPLRVDVSERSAIIAFAGRPDAERRGRNTVASPFGSARYDALGYGCGRHAGPEALPLVQPRPSAKCRTVFFIEARSGRLGLFYTIDPKYRERHGVRVGMPTAEAEKLLGRRLRIGCIATIEFYGPKASLYVSFGGRMVSRRNATVRGGHVDALVLHGIRHDVGLFECL
jgi:hypothetical protein